VKPDVQVPAKEALLTAHILALRRRAGAGHPVSRREKRNLEKLIGELEATKSGNVENETKWGVAVGARMVSGFHLFPLSQSASVATFSIRTLVEAIVARASWGS